MPLLQPGKTDVVSSTQRQRIIYLNGCGVNGWLVSFENITGKDQGWKQATCSIWWFLPLLILCCAKKSCLIEAACCHIRAVYLLSHKKRLWLRVYMAVGGIIDKIVLLWGNDESSVFHKMRLWKKWHKHDTWWSLINGVCIREIKSIGFLAPDI